VNHKKPNHFAAGVLTPALTKGDVQPPLETPFNGFTLKSAWSTANLLSVREFFCLAAVI
jgi:hypothetical protein